MKFNQGAPRAVVKEALKRRTGARGLRAILEGSMLDIMYEMPSQKDLKEVVITEECIVNKADPILVFKSLSEKTEAADTAKRDSGTGSTK